MQQLPDFKTENILALSWKAPYAQLMLRGKIETRTWPTNYRGWVLICCSKVPYNAQQLVQIAGGGICGAGQFNRIMRLNLTVPNTENDFGYAIAIGKLVDCRPMTKEDEDACFVKYKEPWTESKTTITSGIREKQKQLWCHIYEDVTPIEHFPFKGGQGWLSLTEEQINQIKIIQS